MQIPDDVRQEIMGKFESGAMFSKVDRFLIRLMMGQIMDIAPEPAAPNPKPQAERVVFRRARRRVIGIYDYADILGKAKQVLAAHPKPIKVTKLAKKVGMPAKGITYSKFLQQVKQQIPTFKKSNATYATLGKIETPATKPAAKHEPPMHTRDAQAKFMSDRTKWYMSEQGGRMDYFTASHAAIADYSKFCHSHRDAAVVEFPALDSIKPDIVPILKDMLKHMEKSNTKATFKESAYVLDLDTAKEWDRFKCEMITKSDQIAQALGITKSLVSDGFDLYWR